MTNFSQARGFDPALLLAWIRSEVAERYRPARNAPWADPWFGGDPLYRTAWAGVPVEVPA